jgi:hypothetical protein
MAAKDWAGLLIGVIEDFFGAEWNPLPGPARETLEAEIETGELIFEVMANVVYPLPQFSVEPLIGEKDKKQRFSFFDGEVNRLDFLNPRKLISHPAAHRMGRRGRGHFSNFRSRW